MNEDPTLRTLTPNLSRTFVRVFLFLFLVIAVASVWQRFHDGHWWSANYFASLAIPLLLMPTFVCLMFVPRRIQWSATKFQIQPRFRRAQTLPWTQLYAYGSGNNVFLLKFTGDSTFQIFAGAFPREEWRAFQSFLTINHPDKKARFWLGPNPIRK